VFFKEIEKINQEFAVIITSGGVSVGLFPNLGSGPEAFRFGGEGGSTITARHGAVPDRDGRGKEGRIEQPRILKPEDSGRGDGGGGSNNEGDVIGCGAWERGECGAGKRVVPIEIEKSAVEPSENGDY
jgi:hypothetical protein